MYLLTKLLLKKNLSLLKNINSDEKIVTNKTFWKLSKKFPLSEIRKTPKIKK